MKPLHRINLIAEISAYLRKKYNWSEINTYLLYYYEDEDTHLYSWQDYDDYLMYHLRQLQDDKLVSIAEELGMQQLAEEDYIQESLDASFWKLGFYRLFISHIHADKVSANNLKTVLSKWGIHGFVAHEDIRPSKVWQAEIEKALLTMDGLCAIIVPNFYKSKWCDQEVGVALGRKVPIIPIKKGALPHGFIGKYQAVNASTNAEDVANNLIVAMCENPDAKSKYFKVLVKLLLNAKNEDEGLRWLEVITGLHFDLTFVKEIHSGFSSNDNLNNEKVINKANELFEKYDLSSVQSEEAKLAMIETDDLPF